MNRFNAGEANAINQSNAALANTRDQFNAKNQLVIEQSNALWRRDSSTRDTAAVNRANEINAKNVLNISETAYNNLWQEYRDVMSFAYQAGENKLERFARLEEAALQAANSKLAAQYQADRQNSNAMGKMMSDIAIPVALALFGL